MYSLYSVAAASCLLLLAGCKDRPPESVNPADAGQRLREALDAWKKQEPYGALAQRSPSIVFNEPLWQEGVRLLEFELGPVELHGRQGRCTARLILQHKDGKQQERSIGYQIDTTPHIVIVREGLGI